MKPEELADEIERAHQAILDEAGGSGERAWRRARFGQVAEDNFPAILSALRRVEKLEAALRVIEGYVLENQNPSVSTVAGIARQALTGEA